jgi:histidinol dehydrogenase
VIDVRTIHPDDPRDYTKLMPRAMVDAASAAAVVAPICEAVRSEGEPALRRLSQQFDAVVPASLRVDPAIAAAAAEELDPALRESLEVAIGRRRQVCQAEAAVPEPVIRFDGVDSPTGETAEVAIRSIPVNRVGCYIPGGLAPLASSVYMNVVPAQAAGVPSIAIASPPQKEYGGLPHPTILATAHLLGVTEIYAVGGAQALAMFAYGVDGLCSPVDLLAGPGNVYVVAAKRLLRGVVGIDSEAGPTEIAVIADETADPALVAADLISQAEHDPLAASVLICCSEEVARRVDAEVQAQVASTKHRHRASIALEGSQSAVVLCRDIDQAVAVADAYAAEHLEIMTADARQVAARITNAGAIFVGRCAPVSLGDYAAGSTHVLPTTGAARFSSGLNARTFLRTVHVIDYDAQGLSVVADAAERIALAEDLPAHARAITIRAERLGESA